MSVLLFVLNMQSQTSVLWSYDLNDMAFGNAACADIDNDGFLEIVFSTYRNDSSVYALNAEDGSLLWKVNTGGCNDAAPLIFDVDGDGELDVVIASSCVAKTFCLEGLTGAVKWETLTRGSDSPPSVADMNGDGIYDIIHGEFGGYVISLNGQNGGINWEIAVNVDSWVQTAPAILDIDNNGQLDFVVATWVFGGDAEIYAYTGDSAQLIWQNNLPQDFIYHGASFADIDNDGKPELTIGSYDGFVYALNAFDGSSVWSYKHQGANPYYVGAPTSIADLNNDDRYEVVFFSGNKAGVLSHTGSLLWDYTIGQGLTAFRGAAIADVNADDTLDVVFGTGTGELIGLSGGSGEEVLYFDLETHYGAGFDINHGPVIADFNKDGKLDVFVVGGHSEYPDIVNNYGRAYVLTGMTGTRATWPMFRYDERRSGCMPDTIQVVNSVNDASDEITVRHWKYNQQLNVEFSVDDHYTIQLIDLSGRVIRNAKLNGTKAVMNIEGLTRGIYLLNTSCSGKQSTSKIII